MAITQKIRLLLTIFQLVLVFFGLYLALSLFEVWAFFPFWVKNIALFTSLVAIYILARQKLKTAALELKRGKTLSPKEPWALHGISALILAGFVTGLVHAGPSAAGRIGQALTLSLKQPPTEILLTITVNPPAYLSSVPIVVFSENDGSVGRHKEEQPMTFPEGSVVEVKIRNSDEYSPFVRLGSSLDQPAYEDETTFISRHLLEEKSFLDIQVGPYVAYRQLFNVVPDESPSVELSSGLELSPRSSLAITFEAGDDNGIEEVYLELRQRTLLVSVADRIKLPYLRRQFENEPTSHYINLLSHPWAGASIIGTITAVDGLGQETKSDEFLVLLPEKSFHNPISQRLISIRKALFLTPERRNAQVRRLDVLTRNETAFEGNKGIYLALRSAYWRLRSAETEADIDEVTRFLWQAALTLEDDGSLEEQRVFDILKQMTEAVSAGDNLEEFQEMSHALEGRLESFFDIEFKLFSRRLSLDSNIQRIDIPAFRTIRGLIEKMQEEAVAGNAEEAMKTLVTLKAHFEELAVSSFSQARN